MDSSNLVKTPERLKTLSAELWKKYPEIRHFIFKGDLGAGKTTFIQSLVQQLGCDDEINSPTFALVNEYDTDAGTVYHLDLYRVKNIAELEDIGFFEILDSGKYVFIEWPEMIEPYLYNPYLEINMMILENKDRNVIILEH